MNDFDVQRIIQWALKFQRNIAPPDRELSPPELRKAAADCQRGYDAYESAAEISEGRWS